MTAATAILLEGGFKALSIEGIAARAGVAKTTIYRRWSTILDLVADVLEESNKRWPMPVARKNRLADDLADLYQNWVAGMTGAGRVIPPLIAEAVQNVSLADLLHERFIKPRRLQAIAIVERAIARGELPADADSETAIDMFMGRMWYRRLVTGGDIKIEDEARVIRLVLNGLRGAGGEIPIREHAAISGQPVRALQARKSSRGHSA